LTICFYLNIAEDYFILTHLFSGTTRYGKH
jgi:hypothetical protein